MNQHNAQVADFLRQMADYVQMAEQPVKLKLGITLKLKGLKLLKIPVQPVTPFSKSFALWVISDLKKVVTDYKKATGSTDGDDLLAQFQYAEDTLKSLDK